MNTRPNLTKCRHLPEKVSCFYASAFQAASLPAGIGANLIHGIITSNATWNPKLQVQCHSVVRSTAVISTLIAKSLARTNLNHKLALPNPAGPRHATRWELIHLIWYAKCGTPVLTTVFHKPAD